MRLSLTRVLFYSITFIVTPIQLYAQEEFLKLDSIVVIEDQLILTGNSNNMNLFSGSDTLPIIIGQDQYLKVRKVSFTLKSPGALSMSSNLDFWIGTEKNLFIDLASQVLRWSSPYPSNYSNFRTDLLSPRVLKMESFPNEFLTKSSSVLVRWLNGSNWDVYYRIELIYYTYES